LMYRLYCVQQQKAHPAAVLQTLYYLETVAATSSL